MNPDTGKAPAAQRAFSENALTAKQASTNADDCYLPARKVWERYGVTAMSLHRWLRDERMDFPQPIYIGRFRYWRLQDLLTFEQRCVHGRAA